MKDQPNRKVLIVGCGFGGMAAARALRRSPVKITVVDRSNHHLFQPLLYQVATAGLSAPAIAAPIRHILARQDNVTVLMSTVTAIDPEARRARLGDGSELAFDAAILAPGASDSYFGHDAWAQFAPGLKTLEDAMTMRRRVLLAFERAERESDSAARLKCMTFVVVGAGPTGVELAGTLAEIARHTLRREFRNINSRDARVILLEGGSRVLAPYRERLSAKAARQLQRLGVEVRTGCKVDDVDAEGVSIVGPQGYERLASRCVLWAAGVAASPLGRTLGVPTDASGRVLVEPDLSVPGCPDIFVVGDLVALEQDGRMVPGIAPAAKQMGAHAAQNLLRRMRGEKTRPFHYQDYGSLATIGRGSAVAQIGHLSLWGAPAWLFWLFVHIFFLIGFRNRLLVLSEWAWSYFTFERSARIVIGTDDLAGRPQSPRTSEIEDA